MSKNETPMTRWYGRQVGGTMIEEFVAIEGATDRGRRVFDAVIIKGGEFRCARQSEVSIEGKDIIIVQTKAHRLGMYLLGQAFFSPELVRHLNPRSVESVALCSRDDAILRPLFEKYENMKVVVCPPLQDGVSDSCH